MTATICALGVFLLIPPALGQLPPVPRERDRPVERRPRLFVAQRVQDLGNLIEGDKPEIEWPLENHGDADLVIERTHAPCGCTVVELAEEDRVVPPGEFTTLRVVFDTTGRTGQQTKAVNVHTNDPAEPTVRLELTASVDSLYYVKPPGLVNIQAVRRGETAVRTIDIHPGGGRSQVKILEIDSPSGGPLRFTHESLPLEPSERAGPTRDGPPGGGQRVFMTVAEHVGLGPFTARAKLKLSVDGMVREHPVSIFGQVVGDLTWRPRVIDETRFPSRPGKVLEPIRLESTATTPFEILEVTTSGPWLDVSYEPVQRTRPGTSYGVAVTLRGDTPPGPFATTVEIRTSLPDQPVVRVPVFGIVAEPVEVDPPIIILRQDGTEAGTRRRVKLQAVPQVQLEVRGITCDNKAVKVAVDEASGTGYRYLRFLSINLEGTLPEGVHEAVVTVTTNVEGAEKLDVPVRIEVPSARGAGRRR